MMIDLLIKNAFVFMTCRQVFEQKDIAVVGDSIYRVADNLDCYADNAKVIIERKGSYIIPGLVDCHMHVESSMTYPAAFSKAALKYGTTTVVSDPHEMANVFGNEGIQAFLNQNPQMDIFYGVPSSVPATAPEIETSGVILDEADVEQLLDHQKVICLGEVMNFADLISPKDTKIKRIVEVCQSHEKPIKIEGHCPKLTPEQLAAFIRAGVDSDHTQQTPESIREKSDAGMFLELQRKSLNNETIKTVVANELYENVALVTDDVMPDELLHGHLNILVQKAIDFGLPFEKAIYCATHTPARRMNLSDRGMIAPGKIADLVIIPDKLLTGAMEVYKAGVLVSDLACREEVVDFPSKFYNSINCKKANGDDFILKVAKSVVAVDVNAMQLSYGGTFTKKVTRRLEVIEGVVQWQKSGLSLAVIFERYGKNGNISYGLVENALGHDNSGAIATTWSHDSHNLLVIGNDVESMICAQNRTVELQGGYCVVANNEIVAEAPLRIGGIVSDEPVEVLARKIAGVREAIEKLGYANGNVLMSVATLALTVSPELKLTDNGLFNVRTYQFEPLIINEIEG